MIPEELLNLYNSKIPIKLEELQQFIIQGDIDLLRQSVHKLRGSSGTYGYRSVSEECAAWEGELLRGEKQTSNEHLMKIRKLFHEQTRENRPRR